MQMQRLLFPMQTMPLPALLDSTHTPDCRIELFSHTSKTKATHNHWKSGVACCCHVIPAIINIKFVITSVDPINTPNNVGVAYLYLESFKKIQTIK
jgi:hypothetical protein